MGGFDIGVQKTVLKQNGTLKLSLTDVAHTMKWKGVSEFSGAYLRVSGNWESQQLRLNFSYRFGSASVKAARQRNTGIEDENKRLKGGGSGPGGN